MPYPHGGQFTTYFPREGKCQTPQAKCTALLTPHSLLTPHNYLYNITSKPLPPCCWDYSRVHLLLSHDIHPNPGPSNQVLRFLSLNVGGPHLSKRRWGRLLQEMAATEADVIALQEVRFREQHWNMATTSQLLPNYQVVTPSLYDPDVMFLLHSRMAPSLVGKIILPHSGFAIRLNIPGASSHTLINLHGPFTTDLRRSLDQWITSKGDSVSLLMGDFNDRIWGNCSPRPRSWQTLLLAGKLIDPIHSLHHTSLSPLGTRGSNRIDAILPSPDFCTDFPLVQYQTLTFTAGGDHKGFS